jgi:hypothetical protein
MQLSEVIHSNKPPGNERHRAATRMRTTVFDEQAKPQDPQNRFAVFAVV